MDLFNRFKTEKRISESAKWSIGFSVLMFIVLVSIVTMISVGAGSAECSWCPTYKCFGANSCGSCVCVSGPGAGGGNCYSIE
jgi:hypothetical protein